MENFNPRDMSFWAPGFPVKVPVPADGKIETCREIPCFQNMEGACQYFQVSDFGYVPLRSVPPADDLGQWIELGVLKCFVYATIEGLNRSPEVRVLHPNGNELALHAIRYLE